MNRLALGKAGEEMVAEYLKASGYKILARGYRNKCGEIDIIAERDMVIHFIEVKTRTSFNYGLPAEAVNSQKLKHITNVANAYINSMENRIKRNQVEGEYIDLEYVIDVAEVIINHIEGVQ